MAVPTITDYLKYADLQMAAEAFLRNEATNELVSTPQEYKDALTEGNNHSSKFTTTQAQAFVDQWEVLDQEANTETGFSGTLFKNRATGELVISFRSTEFIDDAIRDNASTNTLEIKNTGFAWGQIRDMEGWFTSLNAAGGPLAGQQYAVTGYSLGGHLATAFNLLRREESVTEFNRIKEVITFNGAGVGLMKDGEGTLGEAIAYFDGLRDNPETIKAELNITITELSDLYDEIRIRLSTADESQRWTATQALDALDSLTPADDPVGEFPEYYQQEKAKIEQALKQIQTMQIEVERIKDFVRGGNGDNAGDQPQSVEAAEISAYNFDYRLAVLLAGERTEAASILQGLDQAYRDKAYPGSPSELLTNQYDVVGDSSPSAVAHSQWHYGTDVRVFIEDQPLFRGNYVPEAIKQTLEYVDPKLLFNNWSQNDFGDTHSLVLIVDSLNVQNALLQLLPENIRESDSTVNAMKALLEATSFYTVDNGNLLGGAYQGKAIGDVLENVVNLMANLFLGPQKFDDQLVGNIEGGTWANIEDRETFYERLNEVVSSNLYKNHLGKFSLSAVDSNLATLARTDFAAFATLHSLSPFFLNNSTAGWEAAFKDAWGATYDAWAEGSSPAAGKDYISDQWLTDRADLLDRKIWFNIENINPVNPGYDGEHDNTPFDEFDYLKDDVYFEDVASGYKIHQGGKVGGLEQYRFGDKTSDTFAGGFKDDHLYGRAGTDVLIGGEGEDYIEGNADDDILIHGKASREDDNVGDILHGGTGHDTYFVGDGDTIEDVDGKGSVIFAGTRLRGGSDDDKDGVYESVDGRFTYQLDGNNTLTVTEIDAGHILTINHFQKDREGRADLGIKLDDNSIPTPSQTLTLTNEADTAAYYLDANGGVHLTATQNTDPDTERASAYVDLAATQAQQLQTLNDQHTDFRDQLGAIEQSLVSLSNTLQTYIWQRDALLADDPQADTAEIDALINATQSAIDNVNPADPADKPNIQPLLDSFLSVGAQIPAAQDAFDEHHLRLNEQSLDGAPNIQGLGGNDTITLQGFEGMTADGGTGDDTLIAKNNNSRLFGGADNDTLVADNIQGAQLYGGDGKDALQVLHDDTPNAEDSGNSLFGGDGNDVLKGGKQSDTLVGGVGHDNLWDKEGNDDLCGGNEDHIFYLWKENTEYRSTLQ